MKIDCCILSENGQELDRFHCHLDTIRDEVRQIDDIAFQYMEFLKILDEKSIFDNIDGHIKVDIQFNENYTIQEQYPIAILFQDPFEINLGDEICQLVPDRCISHTPPTYIANYKGNLMEIQWNSFSKKWMSVDKQEFLSEIFYG